LSKKNNNGNRPSTLRGLTSQKKKFQIAFGITSLVQKKPWKMQFFLWPFGENQKNSVFKPLETLPSGKNLNL
jgi:hypothetical protein